MKNILLSVVAGAIFSASLYGFYSKNNDESTKTEASTLTETNVISSDFDNLVSLLAIQNQTNRNNQLRQFFIAYLRADNSSRIAPLIRPLEEANDRQLSFKIALSVWQELDNKALVNWLEKQTPHQDLDSALDNLLKQNSLTLEFSLAYAGKIHNDQDRFHHLSELITQNVLTHSKPIILWAIEKSYERDEWLALAFTTISTQSLIDAINSLPLLENANKEQRHLAIQTIMNNYKVGTFNSDNLLVIQSLTPVSIQLELIDALLPLLVQEPGLTVAELGNMISNLPPGITKDLFYEQIAMNWASKNPKEAAKYAVSLEGKTRELAVNGVVTSWLEDDLEATDAWLKTVDGNIDLAADTLGRGSAMLGNHQVAEEWIGAINDEHMKTVAILDVIHGWYTESPEAGIYHLVYQKHLTDDQKLELLQTIYPGESFDTPMAALDDIGRLEGLQPVF